ncbi:HEAT repeat domain-containing protein [Streptomyces sp. NPDC059917]|uniref:HEAT repeat domain-containing protein n=1 Tax=Streptomyces sp. NPDC059917 TaxID=3347002 RepID=UPI003660A483
MTGNREPDPTPRRFRWGAKAPSAAEPAAPPPDPARAQAERAVAVAGNAHEVITGDGNTVIRLTTVHHGAPHPGPHPGPTAEPPSERAVEQAVSHYARRFAEEYGGLDLEVLTPRREEHLAVALGEVFVAPSVRADPPPLELPRELRRRLALSGELPAEDLLPPGVDPADFALLRDSYLERPEEPVLDVLAGPSGGRTVLLGDPGAGKSTLVRHLVLALTGAGSADAPGALAGRVPLVVELRRYAEDPWRHGDFEEFLDRQHRAFGLCVPGPVRERLLSEGRALVVFDGLDELFDPKVREETARRIAAFAAHRPSARIVVTSRIIGYRRAPLERAGFSHFTLQDLDEERIEEFVTRWYLHACPDDPARAAELTERILLAGAADPGPLREVAGNPLLLTILVIIGARGPLPGTRRGVYERAVEVLVEQWDRAAKLLGSTAPAPAARVLDALGPADRLALLRVLARSLQEGAAGVAGNHIRARDLERVFRDRLAGEYGLAPLDAVAAARGMVTQLHERNFILSRYGGDVYGFVHRAFLEHLAAADIAHRYREEGEWTPEELVERVVAVRADDPAWHEVLVLLIGQLDVTAATAAVDHLLDLHARRTDPADTGHALTALRALAETGGRGVAADRGAAVVDAVTEALDVRGSKGGWLLADAASALTSFERYSAVRDRFLRWYRLSGQFSVSDEPAWLLAFYLRLDEDELALLAHGSHYGVDRAVLLYARGRRRPDEGVRAAVLREATGDANGRGATEAIRVLGELWPDREDVRAFLSDGATGAPDRHRRTAALEALAAGRPDDEAVRRLVMSAAVHDPHLFVRSDALRLLGRRWADDQEVRALLVRRAGEEEPEENTRSVALKVLGRQVREHPDALAFLLRCAADEGDPERCRAAAFWLADQLPGHRDVREFLIRRAAEATDPAVCADALTALGRQAPGHTTVGAVLLRAAAAPARPRAQVAALGELGNHWAGHAGVMECVLGRADGDPDPVVRVAALGVVERCYAGREEALEVLLRCAAPATERAGAVPEAVREKALGVLADQWAARPEVRDLLLGACARRRDPYPHAAVLRALAVHWSERRDVRELLLAAAEHTDRVTASTALDVLGKDWPDHADVRAAVMRVADRDGAWIEGSAAVKLLTERWTDRPDVGPFVLGIAADPAHRYQGTALEVLGRCWVHRDDVREVLARAAGGNCSDEVRGDVVRALGRRWVGHPDVRAVLRRCAGTDPLPDVRFAALRWWVVRAPDDEGEALVAERAVAEPDPEVRRQVLGMLALGWPASPRARAVLRAGARDDADERTRAHARRLLGPPLAHGPDA